MRVGVRNEKEKKDEFASGSLDPMEGI